ncbi:MAG: hypothetical protein ACKVQW_07795 [Pyrinomonadaceae bacterium]
MAQIQPEITEYFRRERPYEQPNFITGDWNGDGRTDHAAMLQLKSNQQQRITVVLMRSGRNYETYLLAANDGLGSIRRGDRGYNYDTGKNFRYKNDAISSYFWEKAGTSYIWERGRFRGIPTSD